MNFKEYLELFISFTGATVSYFFGEVDGLMHALLAFAILDYITGIISAGVARKLSSSIGFKGIAKKITIFIIVGVSHVIDRELLGGTALLRDAVIFFYLANEGLSILENAVAIGIPIPNAIKDKLLAFHDKNKN